MAKDQWWGFSTRNVHIVHVVNLIRLKWRKNLKAVSHDVTSFMRFDLMKSVSPCDRATHVARDCCKRLASCDFSLSANQILDYFSSMGKQAFINSEYMVTIFTYQIHTSIQCNPCVKCERYINKYYYAFKTLKVDRIVWVWEGIAYWTVAGEGVPKYGCHLPLFK